MVALLCSMHNTACQQCCSGQLVQYAKGFSMMVLQYEWHNKVSGKYLLMRNSSEIKTIVSSLAPLVALFLWVDLHCLPAD